MVAAYHTVLWAYVGGPKNWGRWRPAPRIGLGNVAYSLERPLPPVTMPNLVVLFQVVRAYNPQEKLGCMREVIKVIGIDKDRPDTYDLVTYS